MFEEAYILSVEIRSGHRQDVVIFAYYTIEWQITCQRLKCFNWWLIYDMCISLAVEKEFYPEVSVWIWGFFIFVCLNADHVCHIDVEERNVPTTKMRNCNGELSHVIPSSFCCDGRGWFYWSQVADAPREGVAILDRVNFRSLTRSHSSAVFVHIDSIWITLHDHMLRVSKWVIVCH